MYIIWKEAGSSKTYFENMKNIRSEKKYRRALIKKNSYLFSLFHSTEGRFINDFTYSFVRKFVLN